MWVPVKALKLLTNFGHVVSHISLSLESTYESGFQHYSFRPALIIIHIESYVARYCSKSLRRFTFDEPPRFLFKENQNSFINVERIDFFNYSPLCDVPFSKIFPNLKHIDLHIYRTVWDRSIHIAIPSVKNLHIDATLGRQNKDLNLAKNDINELLKLNPQIEDLKLKLSDGFEFFFQDFNENMPMLQRFSLRMISYSIDQRYHSDSVIDFHMNSIYKLTNIPFTFSKLERFECNCWHDDTIPSCIFDFIAENKHLKSITLDGVRHGINTAINKLFQLVSVLTYIEELNIKIWPEREIERGTFDSPPFPSDLILNLFSQSQCLKRLTLSSFLKIFENLDESVKSKIVKQEDNGSWLTITLHL